MSTIGTPNRYEQVLFSIHCAFDGPKTGPLNWVDRVFTGSKLWEKEKGGGTRYAKLCISRRKAGTQRLCR